MQVQDYDFENYILPYTGFTRVKRLHFIASKSESLGLEALLMMMAELKKGRNTKYYLEIGNEIIKKYGEDSVEIDFEWAKQVDSHASEQHERLEFELSAYKTIVVKESIRIGFNDLGDFYAERGEFTEALAQYTRTRDYCTSSRHIVSMSLNIIRMAIHMNLFSCAATYISKAEQGIPSNDTVTLCFLKCTQALCDLEQNNYKLVARTMVNLCFDDARSASPTVSEIMSLRDVAIYGSFCALAEFDRSELSEKVMKNSSFKEFLELHPTVREIVFSFHSSDYTVCLDLLEKLKPELYLDIYLSRHVDVLYYKIRQKALIQYFSPFVSCDLSLMSQVFHTQVEELEKELSELITKGSIQARIDSRSKILHRCHVDQRRNIYRNVIATGERLEQDTQVLIQRINLIMADNDSN